MSEKVNILIFPAGSENAIEIYNSLKYNLHFDVFGASGKEDYCKFLYPKDKLFIDDLYINNKNFFDKFNNVLEKFNIHYIIPTHDIIASFLMEHSSSIKAKIICSPFETAKIAANKKYTYEALKDYYFYPKVYLNPKEISKYPVFLKPYVGAGGKGAYIVNNEDELDYIFKIGLTAWLKYYN